jgi:hypothetical protein
VLLYHRLGFGKGKTLFPGHLSVSEVDLVGHQKLHHITARMGMQSVNAADMKGTGVRVPVVAVHLDLVQPHAQVLEALPGRHVVD